MLRICLILLNIFFVHSSIVYSEELKKIGYEEINEKVFPEYTLGPGDKLSIEVYKMDKFNSQVKVLPDGTINLPRIGPVLVADLSLREANKIIVKEYQKVLKRPLIYIDIIEFRPVSILIKGEVQKPGVYSMGLQRSNSIQSSTGGSPLKVDTLGWPTVIDAIQIAGGITTEADIKNIHLQRKNTLDYTDKALIVDLYELIEKGFVKNNLYVYSGDSIHVKKTTSPIKSEKEMISNSNLSPSTILVNVIGEVFNPGLMKIKANSQPLNALLAAGGLNRLADGNNIKLMRLQNNGSVFTKKFKYKDLIKTPKQEFLLTDKDTIIVPSSNWSKVKQSFTDITDPIIRGLQIYKITN